MFSWKIGCSGNSSFSKKSFVARAGDGGAQDLPGPGGQQGLGAFGERRAGRADRERGDAAGSRDVAHREEGGGGHRVVAGLDPVGGLGVAVDADFVERAVPPVGGPVERADVELFRRLPDLVEGLGRSKNAIGVELRIAARVVNHRQIDVARTGADAARRVLELALVGRTDGDLIDAVLLDCQLPSVRLCPVRHAGKPAVVVGGGAVELRPGGEGERTA